MLKCKRNKFSLSRKVTYINCAYMSPMLKKVEKAGKKGISVKRRPYQISIEDFFGETELLRTEFAQLIDSGQPNRNVLIPSVSYGMANVAQNLPKKKGKILIAKDQFPSNKYPWDQYKVVAIDKPTDEGKSWTEAIIDQIDEEVAAVCLPHTHWVDGLLFDLVAIREKTRATSSALVIDGTQSVGALPFSVQTIDPDALIVAGYKWMFGPYGLGVAYYGEMFDDGKPIEHNWINRKNSEDFGNLANYRSDYQPGALRYEVGEHSNFILVPMLLTAIRQLNKWKPEKIQEYLQNLTEGPVEELTNLGYQIDSLDHRAAHLFGIRFPESIDPVKVKEALDQNRINLSFRGDAIRISPNIYNDEKDMKKLVKALRSAV